MIGFVVFGLVVGVLARLFKPGPQNLGLFVTLLFGLAGSVIGGTVANFMRAGDIFELNLVGSIVAILAAIALLAVAEGMAGSPNSGHPAVGPRPRDSMGNAEGLAAAKLVEGRREGWP